MTEDFWNQFWPQFWGGVASTIFLAVLALAFTYVARLQLAIFFKHLFEVMKKKIALEEEKIKAEYISKK
jgi:hypothetical protein